LYEDSRDENKGARKMKIKYVKHNGKLYRIIYDSNEWRIKEI